METSDIETMPRHSDMIIKVCGMREPDNIRMVASLTPMLMGFIFFGGTKRDATGIDPEVVASLPSYIRPVCVTVDATEEELLELHRRYGFKIFQLHGRETPTMCRRLREDHGFVIFKALPVATAADLKEADRYEGAVDMFVFDTRTTGHGGSGRKFDWKVLRDYRLHTHYLLSGGIGPADVDRIVKAMRPMMAGIDVNSRFETQPGVKDVNMLAKFILTLRKYNEDESIATPFWEKTR